jgi:hypothetical protein
MKKVCTECGYVGQPKPHGLGSFVVDMFLWMFFSGMFLITSLLPLLVFPLVWTIYHLLTYSTVNCPKCENYAMVKLHSGKGRALFQKSAKVGDLLINENKAA